MVAEVLEREQDVESAEVEEVTIRSLAWEAFEQEAGNWDDAVAYIEKALADDPELDARLTPELKRRAWRREIASVAGSERISILNQRPANPDRGALGIAAMATRKLRHYCDFQLPGGERRLCDASPAELLEAIRYYRAHERGYREMARWLELIHEAMRGKPRVGAALNEKALARLRKQAEEE